MGDLIVLQRAELRSPHAPTRDHSAEILFFTGVRYIRMTDEVALPAAKARRRRNAAKARIDRHA